MSRVLADKVTNYNNDGPFDAEKGINIPLNRPLQVAGSPGVSGQYLASTGVGLVWRNFPDSFTGDYNDLTNKPALFSGDYGDLVNRPFVPSFLITTPSTNDYLKYDGSQWINTPFPTIYQYELQLVDQSPSVEINLNNLTTASTVNTFEITGGTGIDVTLEDNIITITGQSFTEYTATDAIRDVGLALQNGDHTDIIFNYSLLNGTISASVAVAHTLSGSSDPNVDDDVTISITDSSQNNLGSVTLLGSDGIGIAWDSNSSTATFSYTDPSPYTLPTATTQVLGGVKVDGSTITIDGNGIITANFIDTGIEYTDLSVSVSTDAGTPNGGISYNSNTGEFTYTNVETALNDITDVVIDPAVTSGDVITYTGSGWISSTPAGFLINGNLNDLGDVSDAPLFEGSQIQWNGVEWRIVPPIAQYASIDFSGYPTPATTSIGYVSGNVILSDDNSTTTEIQYITSPGHSSAEIHACIHAEGGHDIILERRFDTYSLGNWTTGTWTPVTKFSTPSTLTAGGPTYLHFIDNHNAVEPDKINYRLVADGNITVHYGKNNQLTAKQLT